jgi:hypothetical protein
VVCDSAVGVDSPAGAGADVRARSHPALGGWPRRISRRGRSPGRRQRGCSWWYSSRPHLPSAVGSIVPPIPARTRAVVIIVPTVSRWGPSRRRRPRERASTCASPPPRQPSGSISQPAPARAWVEALIVSSWVSRPGRSRCRHRREPGCAWSWRSPSGQPLSSIRGPMPARTRVCVLIVVLTRRGRCRPRCPRGPWCGYSSPAPVSAVGVDAAADAGLDSRMDAHHRTSCQPLPSILAPAPARTVVRVLIRVSPV